MSRSFQPKVKELAKVRVVSTDTYNKNRNNFRFIASIGRFFPNFITTKRNKDTGRCSYVDDTSALTKKTKNDVVKFFSNKENSGKKVAYLVVPKEKQTTKRGKK